MADVVGGFWFGNVYKIKRPFFEIQYIRYIQLKGTYNMPKNVNVCLRSSGSLLAMLLSVAAIVVFVRLKAP
jgi:hypothetical protein